MIPPQPLREYAVLADTERAALVGPRGDVVWMCMPSFDSPAVFTALIGGKGSFQVCPDDPWFVCGGHYRHGSLVFRSRWVVGDHILESDEALAVPASPHTAVLLRRVRAVVGDTAVRVAFEPRAGFGTEPVEDLHRGEDGAWTGRTGSLHFRLRGLTGGARAGAGGMVEDRFVLQNGECRDVVLELSDRPLGPPPDVATLWRRTEDWWHREVPEFQDALAVRDARHAYAVLRGLTSPSGGMVAAATMSLPERAEEGRNYDYRYAWIRDQCYAGLGAAAHGPLPLLDDAVRFVSARLLEHGDAIAPAYTVRGEALPDERRLNLRGYPGGHDVVGNHVNGQFQLDSIGEALSLLAEAARHEHLDDDARKAAQVAVDVVAARWRQPEAGIWELDDRRWTQSRLAAVAGLRAAARWVPGLDADACLGLAETILRETEHSGTHPTGRWQRAVDDPRVDAALLLPVLRGAVPATSPRALATLAAVREQLAEDGYVYRFRPDDRPLGAAEGAFLFCGFATALVENEAGDRETALRRFERNRAACGPPGVYAEEWDVDQRQLRGNLPQAFVHALMLECSARLARPA